MKAKLQLMSLYREPLITRREMPSVRKIHHWTETVSCRDENMPQDQFAGYINTEEAADCAAVQCAGYDVTSAEWFLVCLYDCAEHRAPGHTPAPTITGVRNSGERSQRGFTQFEGFELWCHVTKKSNELSTDDCWLIASKCCGCSWTKYFCQQDK